MDRKSWTLIAVALVLGTWYVLRFTDLGRRRDIQINVSSRPFAPGTAPGEALPILFGLDRDWKLTRVRVVATAGPSAPRPRPIWNLEARAGSEPIRGFRYGDSIAGMQGAGGAAAGTLMPGETYRLELEAGRARGSVEFTPQAAGDP
ncbi:MAG: hypothetical protein KF791_14660 [Verrucomicrobiae bacterium]|nr:hypothetical protein [Verrucomicrobiae bacterium]